MKKIFLSIFLGIGLTVPCNHSAMSSPQLLPYFNATSSSVSPLLKLGCTAVGIATLVTHVWRAKQTLHVSLFSPDIIKGTITSLLISTDFYSMSIKSAAMAALFFYVGSNKGYFK